MNTGFQVFVSYFWNIIFPRWEHNIPTLGIKHSHVGNKIFACGESVESLWRVSRESVENQ